MDRRSKLWRELKQNGSDQAREELVSEYAYLAKYAVDRLNLNPSGPLSYEDLIGHAIVGLIDAIEKYDPDRGVKFETYALPRIRGEVIDVIRQLDWTPRSVRRCETQLREAYALLEMRLGRSPSDVEVAQHLGVSIGELEKMLMDVGQSALLSLDEVIASGGDVSEACIDEDSDPASRAERAEQKRLLAQAIDELPERERTVIALYYYENLTQKEIAAVLEVTESRVCQIHTKAILRLSAMLSRTSLSYALAA